MSDIDVDKPAGKGPRIAASVAVVACAAACALPVIGGLLAGSLLDRILDPPFLVSLVACLALISAVVALRRSRRPDDPGSCGRGGC